MSEILRRAVAVLEELRTAGELGVRELAERMDVPKSTVQRLLADLVDTDLALRDPATRRYRLGPRTLALGTAYQRGLDLRAAAAAPMRALRDQLGETVGLSVVIGDEMIHIDQVESQAQLRRTFEIGRPLPLWSGAPSRLFLAELEPAEVDRILTERREFDYVPYLAPSAAQMRDEVNRSRREGYAIAIEENLAGVATLSVPIRGHDGALAAALSVTGPAGRMTREAMINNLPGVRRAAAEITRALGGGVTGD